MLFSCAEHVEEGLEEVIEDEGPPPKMEKVSVETQKEAACFICHEKAVYCIEI